MENDFTHVVTGPDSVTDIVLAAMSNTADARLKEIMSALIRHSHAFLREVNLTDDEFEQGLDFIRRVGWSCSDSHNEVVLLADVLGLSTLVKTINNSNTPDSTG